MSFIKIIKASYIVFTIYALLIIDVTSLKLLDILPAIFIMWFIYIIFILGTKLNKKKLSKIYDKYQVNNSSWIIKQGKLTLFIIATSSLLASILSAWFYTGKTPISVFVSLFDGNSLYADYQIYAKVQNLSIFTIQKIPFILMMFYFKFVLFYSTISFFIIKNKTNLFDKFYIALIVGSHIYFGLARGTNYELFEIVILIIFILLSKKKTKHKKNKLNSKYFVIISSIGIMIFLFYERISARGYIFDYTRNHDFIYNSRGVFSIISENVAFIIILLYDYFGFGFYYVSNYVIKIWLTTTNNFISGFFPIGYYLQSNQFIQELIRSHLVMSTRWHPDIIIAINYFGIIGVIILMFMLGVFTRNLLTYKASSLVYLTQFIILMQMISFPIGNFVFVSSASTIIVMLLVFVWVWKLFIKKKIVLKF